METRELLRGLALVAALAAPLTGCDDDGGDGDGGAGAAGGSVGGAGGAVGGAGAEGGAVGGAGGGMAQWPEGDCDPLVGSVCAHPFPSMFYMQPDEGTATGWRTRYNTEIMPANIEGDVQTLLDFLDDDGVANVTPFVTVIEGGRVDPDIFSTPHDPAPSMMPDAPVQIFDLDTGERVPVWTEVERRGESPDQRPLIIRPLKAMSYGHRVAVVITDSVRFEDGSTPEPTAAFAALRDGTPTEDVGVEFRREAFEEMFTAVEAAGVPRDKIILAWQAVVISDAEAKGPLPAMVQIATAAAETEPFAYEIAGCISDDADMRPELGCALDQSALPIEDETEWINTEDDGYPLWDADWRRIYGTVELPWFLDENNRVVLDEAGLPVIQGTRPAKFVVQIPDSARGAAPGTVPIVTFGHGLLARPQDYIADDLSTAGQIQLADKMGAIFVGTYWLGLSGDDLNLAAGVAVDLSTAPAFSDILSQGMVNQILMTPFVRRVLSQDDLLQTPDGEGSLVHPEHAMYTGISQGGIFGTTFMALSPYIKTGVQHVPTAGYSHALPHSAQFGAFQMIIDNVAPDMNDQAMLFTLLQRVFDAADPINYMHNIAAEPLTDLGAKENIWQCAIGDVDAPWYGCEMMIRSAGFPQLGPTVREVYGVEVVDAPTAPGANVLQYFDPGLGLPELRSDMRFDTGAHGSIRRNDEVHQQTMRFLDVDEPGVAINPCGGEPCAITPAPNGRD